MDEVDPRLREDDESVPGAAWECEFHLDKGVSRNSAGRKRMRPSRLAEGFEYRGGIRPYAAP